VITAVGRVYGRLLAAARRMGKYSVVVESPLVAEALMNLMRRAGYSFYGREEGSDEVREYGVAVVGETVVFVKLRRSFRDGYKESAEAVVFRLTDRRALRLRELAEKWSFELRRTIP